ncbi:MAG: hypothetical protein IMZ62_06075, partial [Chloroflexi bacterium]|nr:hypothetical protein [Chloroflexota bacterium]
MVRNIDENTSQVNGRDREKGLLSYGGCHAYLNYSHGPATLSAYSIHFIVEYGTHIEENRGKMKKSSSTVLIIVGIVLVLCCCLIVILSGTFYAFYNIRKVLPTIAAYTPDFLNDPTPTPFEITRQPVDASNSSTQLLLEQSIVP